MWPGLVSAFTWLGVIFAINQWQIAVAVTLFAGWGGLLYYAKERLWLIIDSNGAMMAGGGELFITFAGFVVNTFIIAPWFQGENSLFEAIPVTNWGLLVGFVYNKLLILCLWAHFNAATTDPGSVSHFQPKKDASGDTENTRWCKRCDQYKPDRAHHCKVCDRCIHRMDHHCPWINNCVGWKNQRLFILFLVYIAALSVMTLLMLVGVVIAYSYSDIDIMQGNHNWQLLLGVLLTAESFFFLFFVVDFLSEQIESLDSNSTLVETYQGKSGPKLNFWDTVEDIFGENYFLLWLPMPNPNEADLHEPVYCEHEPPPGMGSMAEEVGVDTDEETETDSEDYTDEDEDESSPERNADRQKQDRSPTNKSSSAQPPPSSSSTTAETTTSSTTSGQPSATTSPSTASPAGTTSDKTGGASSSTSSAAGGSNSGTTTSAATANGTSAAPPQTAYQRRLAELMAQSKAEGQALGGGVPTSGSSQASSGSSGGSSQPDAAPSSTTTATSSKRDPVESGKNAVSSSSEEQSETVEPGAAKTTATKQVSAAAKQASKKKNKKGAKK